MYNECNAMYMFILKFKYKNNKKNWNIEIKNKN